MARLTAIHRLGLRQGAKGGELVGRTRAPEGQLLPEDDPRVVAGVKALWCILEPLGYGSPTSKVDWRDVAEAVNAILEADDVQAVVTLKEEILAQTLEYYFGRRPNEDEINDYRDWLSNHPTGDGDIAEYVDEMKKIGAL